MSRTKEKFDIHEARQAADGLFSLTSSIDDAEKYFGQALDLLEKVTQLTDDSTPVMESVIDVLGDVDGFTEWWDSLDTKIRHAAKMKICDAIEHELTAENL